MIPQNCKNHRQTLIARLFFKEWDYNVLPTLMCALSPGLSGANKFGELCTSQDQLLTEVQIFSKHYQKMFLVCAHSSSLHQIYQLSQRLPYE